MRQGVDRSVDEPPIHLPSDQRVELFIERRLQSRSRTFPEHGGLGRNKFVNFELFTLVPNRLDYRAIMS